MKYLTISSGHWPLFPYIVKLKKNDNSKHNNGSLVWVNQNDTYFFGQSCKKDVLQNFSNSFICATRWKGLKIADLRERKRSGKFGIWISREERCGRKSPIVDCRLPMARQTGEILPASQLRSRLPLHSEGAAGAKAPGELLGRCCSRSSNSSGTDSYFFGSQPGNFSKP